MAVTKATKLSVPWLEDLPDPTGRAVLVRATLDRPLSGDPAEPLATHRAGCLAATVGWLLGHGARVTVCGDLDGGSEQQEQTLATVQAMLRPTAARLRQVIAVRAVSEDEASVAELVAGHDLFVNDTLQDSLLPLPSLTVPPRRLPSAAGRSLQHDLEALECLAEPPRPFVAVLGGDDRTARLRGLEGLILRADTVLLGGALARPVLQAIGELAAATPTAPLLQECRAVVGLSRRIRHGLVLPIDLVWESQDGSTLVTDALGTEGGRVVDIGPRTRVRFAEAIEGSRTVLWAGALGRVEEPAGAAGSLAVAAALRNEPTTVLGGDALVRVLHGAGRLPPSAAVLSATDAAIEWLKNGDLPALAALRTGA